VGGSLSRMDYADIFRSIIGEIFEILILDQILGIAYNTQRVGG